MKPEEENNQVNEPLENYGKQIRFFNSFEEQEEDNYRWLASLKPEQHLHHATELIKRVFADELRKNPKIGNHLYFD